LQSIVDSAIDEWCKGLQACVDEKELVAVMFRLASRPVVAINWIFFSVARRISE